MNRNNLKMFNLLHELDGRDPIPRWGTICFSFFTASRPNLGPTQPPIQWVPGALFVGLDLPGRETDHSHPFSAEVKSDGAIPPLPHTSPRRSA
jgi:hypothetical protein